MRKNVLLRLTKT